MIKESLPDGSSIDSIHSDRPKGIDFIQRHMDRLESELIEKGQSVFSPPTDPHFFPVRPVEGRLGKRRDSKNINAVHPMRTRREGL